MRILKDNKIASDHDLPNTGIGIEYERLLSPIFIKSPKYGTRSSIVIMIDNNLKVNFIEDVYNEVFTSCSGYKLCINSILCRFPEKKGFNPKTFLSPFLFVVIQSLKKNSEAFYNFHLDTPIKVW